MRKNNGYGMGNEELYSITARRIFEKRFNLNQEPEEEKPDLTQSIEEPIKTTTKKPKSTIENIISHLTNKVVDESQKKRYSKRPEGKAPSLSDFDDFYYQGFFGLIGDKEAKFRSVLNLVTNTSTIYLGPAGGGKSALQDATEELLPDGIVVRITNPSDIDENLTPENTNGKVWTSREIQILLRGSKNQKDVIKLLSNNEEYKGMAIEFFVTSAAVENDYFQKYIIPNKELMRRLDIIVVKSGFDKIEDIREGMSNKRMVGALVDKLEQYTKEHFRSWVNYWRNLELTSVVDPFSAFHDQYFVKSFKSFDQIKRYHKLEDALIKMKLEDNTYNVDGKEIQILSIKEKYRADSFRKEINESLQNIDDPETIKKYYGWSQEEFEKYHQSIEQSKEEIDWQVCWDSGMESLKKAHQKGLIPFSVISEYLNRHVVNGKVTVIDDYTGEEVILAEHTKSVDKDKIIITELEYLPATINDTTYRKKPAAFPKYKPMKALPAPKGDTNA